MIVIVDANVIVAALVNGNDHVAVIDAVDEGAVAVRIRLLHYVLAATFGSASQASRMKRCSAA